MKAKVFICVLIVSGGIAALMYSAAVQSAKAVMTVDELSSSGATGNIQLGARVAESEIFYQTTPEFLLKFTVHDIPEGEKVIPVVYHGIMPDTLQEGRDVILEGKFDGEAFQASSLLTQCPSKYEPPLPGEASENKGDY